MSDENEVSRELKTSAPESIFRQMIAEDTHTLHDDEKNRPIAELLMMMRDEEGHLEMGWMNMQIEVTPETDRSELAVALRDAVSEAIEGLEGFEIHGLGEQTSGIFYTDFKERDEI